MSETPATVWRPMAEHQFRGEPYRLTVACFALDDPDEVEVFVCKCDKGQYFPEDGMLTCEEQGWRAFAWTDAPPRAGEASGYPGAPCPLAAIPAE